MALKIDWIQILKIVVPIVISIVKPHLAPKAGEIIDAIVNTENTQLNVGGSIKLDHAIGLLSQVHGKSSLEQTDELKDIISRSVDITNIFDK